MKKAVYFLPFLLVTGLVAFLYFMRLPAGTEAYLLLSLLLLSGILLSKGKWWGGLFGILAGASFIYTYFDNVINHLGYANLRAGMILVLFYSVCAAQVFFRAGKRRRM